ncbi:MAG: glycosyl hydrolase family 17 protein [Flavobacteriaceae bacterium]|nr:glycosyl hydrolase family 17 protein [Flavobacteriaceae bacterium]
MKIVLGIFLMTVGLLSCKQQPDTFVERKELQAKDLLGKPAYLAMSYGGYRFKSRDVQPTVPEIKEDLLILSALGVKFIRTYNVHLPQAKNILKAIRELKQEDRNFEMYVMLGAWISCKDAFNWEGNGPDHSQENESNKNEIAEAVRLVNTYKDIVKVLAVGNEAMVHWASAYFVEAKIILKWVVHLQQLKKEGKLPKTLWITSSDDFASWGGGHPDYKTTDLENLVKAVDYVSMHTYPFHNTHYNPEFWQMQDSDKALNKKAQIELAMNRAVRFAKRQYDSVKQYVQSIDSSKAVHIGETGWATVSDGHYGETGSRAADAYKQALYYNKIRKWTNNSGISCFYFEAFDEVWKDANNALGSENHFGLFNLHRQAKYALYPAIEKEAFKQLQQRGIHIKKQDSLSTLEYLKTSLIPPTKTEKP